MRLPGRGLAHALRIVGTERLDRHFAPGDLVRQLGDDGSEHPHGRGIADQVGRGGVVLHRGTQPRLGDPVDPDEKLQRALGRVERIEPALHFYGRAAVSIGGDAELRGALLQRFGGLSILPDMPADLQLQLVLRDLGQPAGQEPHHLERDHLVAHDATTSLADVEGATEASCVGR